MESFEKYLIEQIPNIDISTIHIGLLNDLKILYTQAQEYEDKAKKLLEQGMSETSNIDYTNDMMLNQQRAFERMVPVNEAIKYIRKNTKSNENENKINMSNRM